MDVAAERLFDRPEELRLGHPPPLQLEERMLAAAALRDSGHRLAEPFERHAGLVPVGAKRLDQRRRQDPAEIRDDRADHAAAAGSIGSAPPPGSYSRAPP